MPTFDRGFSAGRGSGHGDPGFFGAPSTGTTGGLTNLHESDDGFQGFQPPARPRSRGESWQRWQMESLDPRDVLRKALAAQLPAEPPPPPAIDFEALDAMRDGARKEGYAQGYNQGQTQGYGDGHREGYARGLEAARNEAARMQQLAANFRDALGRVDNDISNALIGLALDVARQLVRKTVELDPAALLPAARELLTAEPPLSGAPCLLLNPEDIALVETHLSGELEAAGWTLRADPSIARGGCIASAASGEMDASLSTRWQRVVKALGRNDPWEPPHA
ncbi:flagellar assembly protein FliH [Cupriavidus metallidurans]|uniref:flagellar assembly protein FliH n=1 Tax=Cupriavidus metallidurans TaxID=119219 RepID=UPI001CCAC62C|nr:flagellar assembly protein FliH [Cupriavidus metallidurans]UBM08604.1 flagellar assembly protein FliH [Cupriavidus metallidurans]